MSEIVITTENKEDLVKKLYDDFKTRKFSAYDYYYYHEDEQNKIFLFTVIDDKAHLEYSDLSPDSAGFHSHNPSYNGPKGDVVEFSLSNGETIEHSASSVISIEDALRATEHFIRYGELTDWINWKEYEIDWQ